MSARPPALRLRGGQRQFGLGDGVGELPLRIKHTGPLSV